MVWAGVAVVFLVLVYASYQTDRDPRLRWLWMVVVLAAIVVLVGLLL